MGQNVDRHFILAGIIFALLGTGIGLSMVVMNNYMHSLLSR